MCKLQRFCDSAFETLGSTGLFEGVGSNPTVRRYIADLKPKSRLTLPSGLRRQFQVDVSLFLIFFVFFCPFDAPPAFLQARRPMDKGRARNVSETRHLISPCGVFTAPGEASVLVSSAPERSRAEESSSDLISACPRS